MPEIDQIQEVSNRFKQKMNATIEMTELAMIEIADGLAKPVNRYK